MNFSLLLPEWAALATLFILILKEIMACPKSPRQDSPWTVSLIGAGAALLAALSMAGRSDTAFGGMFLADPFALFFKVFFLVTVFFILLMAREFFGTRSEEAPQFTLVLWSSLLGLLFLASANDFLLLFLCLEIFTLSLYILAAYLKREIFSIEAGVKYLVLGSLASAFLIYGISLIYIVSGATSFEGVRQAFINSPSNNLMLLGILLVISGLGFKIASVPFQLWAPDVYQGSPLPVTAYLAVASKAAGFLVLMRLLFGVLTPFDWQRSVIFSALAAMTIAYGNLGALGQTSTKRLLAYSSIGHAGYLLIGLAAGGLENAAAMLYYLMAYGATSLLLFLAVIAAKGALAGDSLDSFRGLAKRSPFLAGTIFFGLLSLAGVPPLGGFFGKFLLLLGAVQSGLRGLALIGALAVAVSLYYYLNIVRLMYFEASSHDERPEIGLLVKTGLTGLTVLIILMGFFQAPFMAAATFACKALF